MTLSANTYFVKSSLEIKCSNRHTVCDITNVGMLFLFLLLSGLRLHGEYDSLQYACRSVKGWTL